MKSAEVTESVQELVSSDAKSGATVAERQVLSAFDVYRSADVRPAAVFAENSYVLVRKIRGGRVVRHLNELDYLLAINSGRVFDVL